MNQPKTNTKTTYRAMYRFWLDITREDEFEIAESIEVLKQERSFTKTIRDGIRLVCDLRQGRVEILLELFPWVEDYFAKETSPSTIPKDDPLRQQIDMLADWLLKQEAAPVDMPARPLQLRVPPKVPEEDLLEIKEVRKDEDNNPSWNFIIASSLQVYGSCDALTPEIIEYGLRTGRIPPGAVRHRPAALPSKPAAGNPKKMDVPDLAPPSFDDLDFALSG